MEKQESRRWSIVKRLEFIEFRLFWEGSIRRSDIIKRFAVSLPQASKDISVYQEMAAGNMEYDLSAKRYLASPQFKPVFANPDADSYFWQMRDDAHAILSDGFWLTDLPPHDMVYLPKRHADPEILRQIIAVLKNKQAIEVFYQSMSSDEPAWRVISPHNFAFDGHRWHVRALCHRSNHYKDFLITRIQKLRATTEAAKSAENDKAWHDYFTLRLKPHPKLTDGQAKAVERDYNMADGKLDITVRLALLYYYLRRLGLEDCNGDKKSPREQHVVVENTVEALAAVKSVDYSLLTTSQ